MKTADCAYAASRCEKCDRAKKSYVAYDARDYLRPERAHFAQPPFVAAANPQMQPSVGLV